MLESRGLAVVSCTYTFMRRTRLYVRVLLLFLASFLQELALLHGWIEHALLPPDYMDLSGIYINSTVAARVCATVDEERSSQQQERYRFVINWEGCNAYFHCYGLLGISMQTYQYVHVSDFRLHWLPFWLNQGTHANTTIITRQFLLYVNLALQLDHSDFNNFIDATNQPPIDSVFYQY